MKAAIITLVAALSAALLLFFLTEQGGSQRSSISFESNPALKILRLGSWRPVHTGIELRRVMLERADARQEIELTLIRIDSRQIAARVLRSADLGLKNTDVKTFADKSRAVAAINANYFDENGRALGFVKTASGGNLQVSRSPLFTGIFGVRNNEPFIVHSDGFKPDSAHEGLQAGPLLIHKGKALDVTRGVGRQSRRALIGIDKDSRILLAVTGGLVGGLTWVELQEFFGSPKWQAPVVDLLNLDGGGSAQLYLKVPETEEHVLGSAPVPVALGFFAPGAIAPGVIPPR